MFCLVFGVSVSGDFTIIDTLLAGWLAGRAFIIQAAL